MSQSLQRISVVNLDVSSELSAPPQGQAIYDGSENRIVYQQMVWLLSILNSDNQKVAKKKDRGRANCKYFRDGQLTYIDKDGQPKAYICSRRAKKGGYCIFHHPDYWREHPEEVRREFYDEVKHRVSEGQDVVCIGYNLPEIRVAEMGVKEFGLACFRKCSFQFADFAQTTFERADFSETAFGSASFSGSTFKFADFTMSAIEHYGNFAMTRFESADFQWVRFMDEAYFYQAKFREADFSNAALKNANFEETLFESVYFSRAAFAKTDFSGTTIKSTSFRGATFKTAHFFDVLLETADFSYSVFKDIAVFKKELSMRYSDLLVSTKRGKAAKKETGKPDDWKSDKYWSTFTHELGRTIEDQAHQAIIFHLATFRNPKNVTFVDFPLSNISFLMTDVTDIMIIGEVGEILSEKLLRSQEHGMEVTEAKNDYYGEWLNRLDPYLRYETVLAEYRNIRKSFEKNRTFAEASALFVKEMRLQRRKMKKGDKAISYLYDFLSSYGELYWRPLSLSGIVILLSPFVLCILQQSFNLDSYLSNLANVFTAFVQMPIQNKAVELLVRVTSIILLGNVLVAFWRRLDRT